MYEMHMLVNARKLLVVTEADNSRVRCSHKLRNMLVTEGCLEWVCAGGDLRSRLQTVGCTSFCTIASMRSKYAR